MTSQAHNWRETFALLGLVLWTTILAGYLLTYLLGLIGPIHDWNFVPPPIAGWTWDDTLQLWR